MHPLGISSLRNYFQSMAQMMYSWAHGCCWLVFLPGELGAQAFVSEDEKKSWTLISCWWWKLHICAAVETPYYLENVRIAHQIPLLLRHLLQNLSRDFQSVCSTSAFLPSVSTHHKWSSVVLRFSTNLSEELWFLSCFQFVQTEESSWPRYGQLKKDLELDYFISVTHFGGLVEWLQDGNASWKIWESGEHKQSSWTMQHPLVHPINYQHGTAKQRQRLLYHS